jgi:hypothetical protein
MSLRRAKIAGMPPAGVALMLTAIPRHWFSWNFTLLDGGQPFGELGMAMWREKGGFTISNTVYRISRERLFSGGFVLESNGVVIATARKPSAFTRRLLIEQGGVQYELRPRSMFLRGFQLRAGDQVVGTLLPDGFLSRRMNIDLPGSIPMPMRAFLIWLTVLMWKREADSAGAS